MADNYQLSATVTADVSNFQASMDKAKQKLQTMGGDLKTLGDKMTTAGDKLAGFGQKAMIGMTLPLAIAGGAIIKSASDYSENLNKVNVAFGESGKAVTDWSNNAIKNFGLSKNQAMSATSLFGDMATSMGLAQAPASDMSMSLAGLAGDMASFKNVSIDEAMTALKGVFTGEGESLKGMGVVMNEATLSAYALAQGITKPMNEMTQAEKVQLRYGYVMEMTKNAQGDYANTSDGTANSIRTFKGTLDNLAIVLGEKVLPIFTPMVQKATELAEKFANASPQTQKLVLGLGAMAMAIAPLSLGLGTILKLGGSFATISTKLIPLLGGTGTGFKALGMATKGFLLPILPLIIAIGVLVAIFKYLWDTNDQFRNSIMLTMSKIKDALMPVFQKLGAVFADVAKQVAPLAIQFAEFVGKVIVAVSPLIVFFAKVFGGILSIVIDIFGKVFGTVADVFSKIKGVWKGLGDFVGKVFDGVGGAIEKLVNAVKGFVNGVIGGVNFALKIINKIPGVEIGLIPKLAVGTDNFAGGVAMINEKGGEIVNLPSGSQVIPHDLSKQYIKESARSRGSGVDMTYMADRMAEAVEKISVRNTFVIGSRVVADEVGNLVNRFLGKKQELARRGV